MNFKIVLSVLFVGLLINGCALKPSAETSQKAEKEYIYKNDIYTKKAVAILIDKVHFLEEKVDLLASGTVCDIPLKDKNNKNDFEKIDKDIDGFLSKDTKEKDIATIDSSLHKNSVDTVYLDAGLADDEDTKDTKGLEKDDKDIKLAAYLINKDFVNIRKSRDFNNNIVQVLSKGDTVYVSHISNGWAKIGKNRWVRISTLKKRDK